MLLRITNVENGAQYEERIFDFWIDVELNDGNILKVFDYKPFDLRTYTGKEVNALLLGGFPSLNTDSGQVIEGEINEYLGFQSEQWKQYHKGLLTTDLISFNTSHGTILIAKSDIESMGLKYGQKLKLSFTRIDLVAIKE